MRYKTEQKFSKILRNMQLNICKNANKGILSFRPNLKVVLLA